MVDGTKVAGAAVSRGWPPASREIEIGAILLLALVLRCYHIERASLWSDELFTAFYPHLGLAHLWGEGLVTEPTSPLYYTLIWGLEHLLGQNALAVRLPSLLGSLLGIFLAGRLADELGLWRGAARLGMLLLALSPTDLFYAQEARSYALQGAAVALALLGFARVLRGRLGADGLGLYCVGAVLAIWLHPTSLLAIAAINLAAIASAILRAPPPNRSQLWRWVLANAAIAILSLPLLPVLFSSTGAAATGWIPKLDRWALEGLIGTTLAGPGIGAATLRIAEVAVPLLAALFLLPPWRPGRRALIVLAVAPCLFLALMTGISLSRPILLARTIAWTLIPLAVALGDVLARRHRLLAVAGVALCAVALAANLQRIDTLKEDWKGLLARLPDLSPQSLVVLSPHSSPGALALYAPGAGTPVRLDDGMPPVPETTLTKTLFGTTTITQDAFAAAIASGSPVWLLYRRPEYEWMRKATAGLPPPKLTVQDIPGSNPNIRALFW